MATEKSSDSEVIPEFTAAEVALYKRRLEEGYDLTTDVKYIAWLKLQDTGSKLLVIYVACKCYCNISSTILNSAHLISDFVRIKHFA